MNSKYWFIFYKDQLLLQKEDNKYSVPFQDKCPINIPETTNILSVGKLDNNECLAIAIDSPYESPTTAMTGLRASYDILDKPIYLMAGKCFQFIYWDKHSQYCPACGTHTEQTGFNVKVCPNCHYELYPRISPAIIVRIRKDDSILLVHARNFKGSFKGLVAGFLEVGETLEECVIREVMEETGLTIKNIRYFASQPWPYPSGLMIGFTADYVSGTIKLQDDELSSGAFFSKDNLPEIPKKLSMARMLIDDWIGE